MNVERIRVRLREILGDRAPLAEARLRPTARETLAASGDAREESRRGLFTARTPEERRRHGDLLLALSILDEMVAWDLAGPNTSLRAEPVPYEVVGCRSDGPRLFVRLKALRDCGSTVLCLGGSAGAVPPLEDGAEHECALDPSRGAGKGATALVVLRGELRWEIPLPHAL